MNNEIKTTLDELTSKIQASKEFQEYTVAKQSWEKSKDAQELLQKYIDTRNTLRVFQQGNFPGVEEQQELLKSLYKQVDTNTEIQEWSKAQDSYQKFIWEMAGYITETTGFDFTPKPKGGCC